jgi:hypothetical protein
MENPHKSLQIMIITTNNIIICRNMHVFCMHHLLALIVVHPSSGDIDVTILLLYYPLDLTKNQCSKEFEA